MNTDKHGLRDEAGEKRQKAAAVQNLAEMRSGSVNAKRLGVRQPSGALEWGNGSRGSAHEASAKLKAPITADRKFEDVVKSVQDAAVLVLVY